ncbi:hypothetical protein N7G274_004205 [Stereocaulon virgatum]|uniref:protein-tyrosine-phosphatase n=1 Tax=Stereocaulon virgatum TaxID=373712 RepID=A0ABR4ABJ4_9LECA
MYDGPHTPPSFSDFRSSRSNDCPTEGSHGAEVVYASQQRYTPTRRIYPATFQESSMPVTSSSQSLLASLPSFMSVFGNGPDKLERNGRDTVAAEGPDRTINIAAKRPHNNSQLSSPILRRDSTSTFNESYESSPTTTISTIESSLTEPSPNSPPESPESLLPFATFKTLRASTVSGQTMEDKDRKDQFSSSFPNLPGVERAESPNKKMRNMKNLSVNTSASNRQGTSLPKLAFSNTSISSHAFSAPPTPAFIVPPKAPRKKPSNLGLTITTPEAPMTITANDAVQDRPSFVPSTPSDYQIRSLRALQISSSGPLHSPTVAPEGGMRLPAFGNPATSSRFAKLRPPLSFSPPSSESTASSPVTKQTLEHVQEEIDYDLPLSQEVKSPAYPQGPVCIYDPLVYLYLEPSDIEAREFDVVLNVAREVKNPFTVAAEETAGQETQEGKMQMAMDTEVARFAGRDNSSEPQTASSEQTFSTALEEQSDDATRSAPTTPKARKPEPEYIHIPWDHNTNVVEDLLRLCELIDDRVRQEKRVLVHCQCGVSRSASLVVAYGLYKNPQLTVQEAYDAVKNRSKWIGPNMNLIYQLSEFKSKLPKRHGTGVSAWHSWRSLGIARSNPNALLDADMKNDLLSSSLRSPPQKSLSLPSQSVREPPVGRSNSFSPPSSAQLAPVITGNITPGPSSAPPDMQWSPGEAPKKFEADIMTADNKQVEDNLKPPRLMDAEKDIVLSPSTMESEGIEEKAAPPAGGVANDLQEVAKELYDAQYMPSPQIPTPKAREADSTEHGLATLSPPSIANMAISDAASSTTVAPAAKGPELALPPRPLRPMPSLPAGFSSLLSRRQGPLSQRQPRLGQELPRLVPVQPSQRLFDPDVPSSPSLLSPRAAEFTASPFHRTAAGDLACSSIFEQGLMSPRAVEQDPRSPHQKGEAPITRSIFDMI